MRSLPAHCHPIGAAVGTCPEAPVGEALNNLRTAEDVAPMGLHDLDAMAHRAKLLDDCKVNAFLNGNLAGGIGAVGDAPDAKAWCLRQ